MCDKNCKHESKRHTKKKGSAAPWVLAAGAGLVMAASGMGASGGAEAAPSKPLGGSPGVVVAQAAKDAGFTGNDLVIAIAVAKAESGWKPGINNAGLNSDGSTDYGLWQVNSGAHPNLIKQGNWRNPASNARMARSIWSGCKCWRPWASYNAGKHQKFMAEARNLAAGVS
jgi:hypothetical protein